MLSKITSKAIVGNVAKAPDGELYNVFGIVHRSEIKQTNYGDSVLLIGSFKATRPDGAAFISGKAYLPPIVADAIDGALAQSEGPVEFAVQCGKKTVQKKDGTNGYEYTVRPLIDTAENSPIDALEKRAMLALQEPAPAEKKTQKKAVK